jgi:hypothetical protein
VAKFDLLLAMPACGHAMNTETMATIGVAK